MLHNRRQFLRTAGWIAGVAAVSGLPLAAPGLSPSVMEREVSEVISRYGNCVGITRKAGQAVEFRVRIYSHQHFAEVFDPQHLPFERIYVGRQNTLKISHHEMEFTIVNIV